VRTVFYGTMSLFCVVATVLMGHVLWPSIEQTYNRVTMNEGMREACWQLHLNNLKVPVGVKPIHSEVCTQAGLD